MLSRAAYIAGRNGLARSQYLYAAAREIQVPHNDTPCRQYHVGSIQTINSSKVLAQCVLKSNNTFGVKILRNLSSTSVAHNAVLSLPPAQATPAIPDIPTIPIEDVVQIGEAGESLASLGLGNWTPVGLMQNALEYLHVTYDLQWWICIAVVTTCVRILLTPLMIHARRNAAVLHNNMPQVQHLQNAVTVARQTGNAMEVSRLTQELMFFMKEKGVNPLKGLLVPLAQAPIFISMFMGLRQMVNAPVLSLTSGGILWFTDLTVHDPYFILPAITSLSLWATIELSTKANSAPTVAVVQKALRLLPIIILPVTMYFPAAILCYWTTSNVISLIQAAVFKIPAVEDICKIERLIQHKTDEHSIQNKGFVTGLNETMSNYKLSSELEERRRLDEINNLKGNQGINKRIYSLHPKETKSSPNDK